MSEDITLVVKKALEQRTPGKLIISRDITRDGFLHIYCTPPPTRMIKDIAFVSARGDAEIFANASEWLAALVRRCDEQAVALQDAKREIERLNAVGKEP